jgi:hypothetical protein
MKKRGFIKMMELFWMFIIIAIVFEVLSWKEKSPDEISMKELDCEPTRQLTSDELVYKERKRVKQEAYWSRRKEREEKKKIQEFRNEIKDFEKSVGIYE